MSTTSARTWQDLLAQRHLLDLVPVGFAVLDEEVRCIGANRTWATLLAVHPDTLIEGRHLGAFLPRPVAELLDDLRRETLGSGMPARRQCEVHLSTGPRLLNLTCQASADGPVTCWVTDATYEREAERHDERFRKLFTESPVGAAIVGHDGRWYQVNPELSTVMGLPEEAMLGRFGMRLVHPQDVSTLERTLRAARATGRASCELRLLRRDGSAPRFDVTVSRIACGVGGEHYFVVHFQDAAQRVVYVPARQPTVVIVDDEQSSAILAGEMLRDERITLFVTTSPRAALTRIENDPSVELLVTDLLMPGMPGEKLIERSRRAREGLKVLVISSFPPRLPASAEPDPHTTWLPKPFESSELVRNVRRMLELPGPDAPAPPDGATRPDQTTATPT